MTPADDLVAALAAAGFPLLERSGSHRWFTVPVGSDPLPILERLAASTAQLWGPGTWQVRAPGWGATLRGATLLVTLERKRGTALDAVATEDDDGS